MSALTRLLVLNAGSSTLKFKLFGTSPIAATIGGVVERIGDSEHSVLNVKSTDGVSGQRWSSNLSAGDHVEALRRVLDFLSQNVSSNIRTEVAGVGHRIVHGLDIHKAVRLTDNVVATIRKASALAPLHNPPGLQGVAAAQQVFKGAQQVAVFDTAFHQTMPDHAFMYGLPFEFYNTQHIRRYGFHGTSHKYLAQEAAKMLHKPLNQLNAITCHLGNGSSITAIKNGQSIDTSMGMTPLEGVMMGTRSGDVDPAVVLHIMRTMHLSPDQMDKLLNKQSGLQGVCGQSDMRSVLDLAAAGDGKAKLALDMFVYRVTKYIGSYVAALGGNVDALVFSAGIGENSPEVRRLISKNLQGMGFALDDAKNFKPVHGQNSDISGKGSKARVLLIPTDEELSIAQQTHEVMLSTPPQANLQTAAAASSA